MEPSREEAGEGPTATVTSAACSGFLLFFRFLNPAGERERQISVDCAWLALAPR